MAEEGAAGLHHPSDGGQQNQTSGQSDSAAARHGGDGEDKFHLFPKLPAELRTMIWRATVDPVELKAWTYGPQEEDTLFVGIPEARTFRAMRHIYHVCRESRDLAIKDYGQPSRFGFPFNPREDVVVALRRPNHGLPCGCFYHLVTKKQTPTTGLVVFGCGLNSRWERLKARNLDWSYSRLVRSVECNDDLKATFNRVRDLTVILSPEHWPQAVAPRVSSAAATTTEVQEVEEEEEGVQPLCRVIRSMAIWPLLPCLRRLRLQVGQAADEPREQFMKNLDVGHSLNIVPGVHVSTRSTDADPVLKQAVVRLRQKAGREGNSQAVPTLEYLEITRHHY